MRKFLLLFSMFFVAITASAQQVTLYFNDFEGPGDTAKITQDTIKMPAPFSPSGIPPKWMVVDTFGYNSDSSFHVQGSGRQHAIYLNTDTIDATGLPYIYFSFWHIAKLNTANEARLEYSIDGGKNYTAIPIGTTYQGASPNYGSIDYFNQISYGQDWDLTNGYSVPLPSWWKKETFDLTGVLSDTANGNGHDSIIIRFLSKFIAPVSSPPAPAPPVYAAGWYVDDILLTGAPCELNPPAINFNFTPQAVPGGPACFVPNPEGGQVELASGNYPVAARVTDVTKPYDTGVDSVFVVYKVNGGTLDTFGLTPLGLNEYRGFFPNLLPNDVVDWFMMAYDKSCDSNITRSPDLGYNSTGFYNFFIEKGLPGKCGTPNCGIAPYVVRTFPWTENFDGTEWVAASGANISGTIPTDKYWERNYQNSEYGWTVRSGPTPSKYTGPSSDHTTGSGKYLHLESNGTHSAHATLKTPCFDLTNETGCLAFEFYYHMFGSEMGELMIDIDTGQGIVQNIATDLIVKYSNALGEHQKSSTEPWQRAVLSLTPFVGKYIKIYFRSKPTAGTPYNLGRGDVAIDDFRIYTPSPIDAELTVNTEPKNGYCSFTGQPVTVVIRNNGCNPLSSVPIKYQVNSGTPFSETATLNPPLELGDTVSYTFTNLFPSVTPGVHKVTAWTELTGDTKASNDTAKGPDLEYDLPITTFPFIEDFEGGTVGTQNLGNSNWHFDDGLEPGYKWQIGEEMTPETKTGPYRGYHYEGKYLYAVTNGSIDGSFSTYLRTYCLDLATMGANHNATLDFYYHLYGANVGSLEVQVSMGDESIEDWTTVATISGAKQNKEMDDWKFQRVDLSGYSGSIKIRFKATRAGSGLKSNLAIDKIMIYNRAANDGGGYKIDVPPARGMVAGPNTPNDPVVSITNFGYSALNTCTINFRVTPLCNPSAAVTYKYYYGGLPAHTSIAQGATQSVNISSVGVVYPIGEFEACVFVTSPNGATDNISFNDTVCRHIVGGNNPYDIAWTDNFDTCDYDSKGFITSQGFWQWELGKPSVSTPAGSGLGNINTDSDNGWGDGSHNIDDGLGNAWVTNIDGPYIVGTSEELRLPFFEEFDTVVNAILEFDMNLDFGGPLGSNGSYNVGATLRYYNQGNWEPLGGNTIASNLGTNWYGGANGATSIDVVGNQPGWIGGSFDGNWIHTTYPLNQLSLDSSAVLALRFVFASKPGMAQADAGGGMGIDNFRITIPPQNSASPTRVITESPLPLPGFDQTLNITILNTGEKVLDSCLVAVTINGTPLGAPQWFVPASPIQKQKSSIFTYPTKWLGPDVKSGPNRICVETSRPNGKPDARTVDDTLCEDIPVLLELDFTESGQDEYCEDFESSTTFQWIHKDAKDLYKRDDCWAKGDPTKFGTAHSGSNAWVTNLTKNYDSLEQAALFTPVFEVDSGIQYKLEFYHWIETEKYHDGGNVEYSFDGGITWYPIGYAKDTSTWYNTTFVTALDQIRGGWTDTTGGWINATQRIVFEDHGKVILRFRFGSDYDIQKSGWAIDDFCWSKDTSSNRPDAIIGEGEYQLPEEAIVGDMVPNPATDYSELSFLFPTPQDVEIRVYNLVGQLMESRSESFRDGVNKVTFNTVGWSAGIYFVNFEYGGKLVTRKLVVQ